MPQVRVRPLPSFLFFSCISCQWEGSFSHRRGVANDVIPQSLVFVEQVATYVYQNVNFQATVKLVDDHKVKVTGYGRLSCVISDRYFFHFLSQKCLNDEFLFVL